jgi:hypothetical protein
MGDYTAVRGKPTSLTYTAGAAITGGQVLYFSAADTVTPTAAATLAIAGVAGHDAASGAPVTVLAGSGVVHETTSTDLSPPAAPVPTTAASGGTVAAGVYTVAVSYVNAAGESMASATGQVTTVGATSTLTVPSPPAAANATGWYAYVSQVNAAPMTRQQTAGSPTSIGTALTITAPPTSGGLAPPSSDTSGFAAGSLLASAAAGQVIGGASAGSEIGISVRTTVAGQPVRWVSRRF